MTIRLRNCSTARWTRWSSRPWPAAAATATRIARAIEEATDEVVDVEEGSLYPALYRMEKKGWIEAEWGALRAGPAREVLPAHAAGAPAAGGADGRMGALCRRDLARAAAPT